MEESQNLTDLLASLGGAGVNPKDIEWALDIPAGKTLLRWLSEQLEIEFANSPERSGQGINAEEVKARALRAALRSIALDDEEVALLNGISKKEPNSTHSGEGSMDLASYLTPSELRQRTLYLQSETAIRNHEINYLKTRLELSKKASHKMAQTLKSLRQTIEETDSGVRGANERIAELSLKADTAISSTSSEAVSLLASLGAKGLSTNGATEHYNEGPYSPTPLIHPGAATLASLSSVRDQLVSHIHTSEPDAEPTSTQFRKLFPAIDQVRIDALFLQASFDKVDLTKAEEGAFYAELEKLCESYESGKIPSEFGSGNSSSEFDLSDESAGTVNVYDEVEQAWALDQASILHSRARVLDEVLDILPQQLLNPLEALHDGLKKESEHIREAEALLRAFSEELVDLNEDINFSEEQKHHGQLLAGKVSSEAELIKTLKELKHLRSPTAAPLVVLNTSDVISELEALLAHEKLLQVEEERWIKSLETSLRDASSRYTPLKDAIYANSAINTSPPFGYPSALEDIRGKAVAKAGVLEGEVGRLRGKTGDLVSGHGESRKKLGAFVDRWTGHGK